MSEPAHHWDTRRIYAASVDVGVFDRVIEVAVHTEVPRSADEREVSRHGNQYWPTLIDVEVGEEHLVVAPAEALALAKALAEAAHMATTADEPYTDRCGHWAPCDCGLVTPEAGQ